MYSDARKRIKKAKASSETLTPKIVIIAVN
jgi:hypothetical protein